MPEAISGADALGGNGGGNANNNSGNDGGGGNNNSNNGNGVWYGNITDTNVINLINTKGWDKAKDASEGVSKIVTAYGSLEQMHGKLASTNTPRPAKDADQKTWNEYYAKIAPSDPKDYNIEMKEGMNKDLVENAKKWFHELGIDERQGPAFISKYNAFVESENKKVTDKFAADTGRELKEFADEQGSKFDDSMELSKRAVAFLEEKTGFDKSKLSSLEKAIGTKTMLKMFLEVGRMTAEARSPDGGGNNAFMNTPDYAKNKISELRADKDFMGRYMNNNIAIRERAIEEMLKWQKQAHGDAPVT